MSGLIGDATGAGAVATAIGTTIGRVMDTLFPTEAQKASADAIRVRAQIEAVMAPLAGQIDINKAEAASGSVFVAGWRPAIGWVCAAALAYQYLAAPLLPWVVNALGGHAPPMPGLDENLWQLMAGMLGLGAFRTYEKVQGVASGAAIPSRAGR